MRWILRTFRILFKMGNTEIFLVEMAAECIVSKRKA